MNQHIYQKNGLIFLLMCHHEVMSLLFCYHRVIWSRDRKVCTSAVIRCAISRDRHFKISVFWLWKDRGGIRQTDIRGSSPGFTMTSFPCLVWTASALGQNVWRDPLTPSVIVPPSAAPDLKPFPAGGALLSLWHVTRLTLLHTKRREAPCMRHSARDYCSWTSTRPVTSVHVSRAPP